MLTWTLEEQPELALRIAGSLLYLEVNWLPPREALSWLESTVEATRPLLEHEESKVRISDFIQASLGLALAQAWLDNYQALHQHAEEAIQLSRRHNLPHYLVVGISTKHIANAFFVDPKGMQELEEAVSLGRKLGLARELALALLIYGVSLFAQSENETTVPYLRGVLENSAPS